MPTRGKQRFTDSTNICFNYKQVLDPLNTCTTCEHFENIIPEPSAHPNSFPTQHRHHRHNPFCQILGAWSSCPHLAIVWHWDGLTYPTWPSAAALGGHGHLCLLQIPLGTSKPPGICKYPHHRFLKLIKWMPVDRSAVSHKSSSDWCAHNYKSYMSGLSCLGSEQTEHWLEVHSKKNNRKSSGRSSSLQI